jgi:hypothetical protein
LPLALKDAGIYHNIGRTADGDYTVEAESIGWFGYFVPSDTFHALPGDTAYAYTAIFSPARFNTDIVHEWQKYDDVLQEWVSVSRTNLLISGGREGGFRTYSFKQNIEPGRWRVDVETVSGNVIGRLRFKVVDDEAPTSVTPIIKK